ncbi:family 1 glycosylhydrolase [Streptomyces sp. NPDC050842]|uniref:family 1 glycosylhydrolase n=1 Tax=Streptomyces sp. NPDC050842 TaxID=3365636 RepID=UPI0037A2ACB1
MNRTFPEGFVWGTAAAAYQVEGAWDADGKAPSVWDTASQTWLKTPDGTNGDVAIDQYHRLDQDLDLLQRLGAGAHRFSVSWPRIVTDAKGTVNQAGLDYYERMVDGLLARGIAPALNLYHWDTPQWLEDLGGMMDRDFADRLADLATVVAGRLGDRVSQWFTMNEPSHPSLGGYVAGFLPPARKEGSAGLATVHHLLLGHGRSIQALRAAGVQGEIGTILSLSGVAPATSHPDDVQAAERAEHFEGRLFLDPMLGRGHLPEMVATLGDIIREGDEEIIAQPIDVLGVNWYSRYSAASPERATAHLADLPARGAMFAGLAPATAGLGFAVVPTPGLPWGGAHRQLTPGGLRHALDWVAETYPDHPDMVITENGVGYPETADAAGFVQDDTRIRYLGWALTELSEAIADGARVRGHHVWTSFDNFQWMAGFSQRFGLVHVDPETLVRTPKASFAWLAEAVRTGTVPSVPVEPLTGDHTGIDLPRVRNARGLGGLRTVDGRIVRDGVVFRSAGLHRLGDEGRTAIAALDITTLLDLRGEDEVRRAPDEVGTARVVHLPLHTPRNADAGAAVGAAGDVRGSYSLKDIYLEIVRERGAALVRGIREIATSEGAVLAHCTAGKDRTGVFIAVLLAALGVRDDDIVRTYAESSERLGDGFLAEVSGIFYGDGPEGARMPDSVIEEMLSSPADYIEGVLANIRHDHGTVAAYLLANGLEPVELQRVREKLLA